MNKYFNKYLKYKLKYTELNHKILQDGGANIIPVQSIKNALENIETNSYQIFKMNYTEENLNQINLIKITKNENYDFFGSTDIFLTNESNDITRLIEFICRIGDNSEELAKSIVKIIKNIVKVLELGYNKKYCWITIRTSQPNNYFEIPRWHCDGKYFKNYLEPQTKFVTVFKGAGTLLIEPINQSKQIYNNYFSDSFDNIKLPIDSIESRKMLDKEFESVGIQKKQLTNKQGLIFLSGHSNCTIHSEPNITEPRMFLSVVFGDKDNIFEWRNKKYKK
jgi:hypothetical protein